jgi:cytochrome oxidase Cu insertion factor (SCO1/SenC/PrrC family)
MKTNWFATLLTAGSILFSAAAVQAAMPQAGDAAPAFTGQDQDGKAVNLADLTGKKIVLLLFSARFLSKLPACLSKSATKLP